MPEATPGVEGCQAAAPRGNWWNFCNVSTVMASARKTVRSAWTQGARGLWRDQPVHLRTLSSSKPTSSMAASTRRSIVHRVPATRTTLATVVSWGAKTTDAGRSVGSLRRPRTTSQRRRHGQPAPGIPPWPLGSIPARRCVQPSAGRVARSVSTWRYRPSRQTSAGPDPSVQVSGPAGDHRPLVVAQARGRCMPQPHASTRPAAPWKHDTMQRRNDHCRTRSHFKTCRLRYHNAMNCRGKREGKPWHGEDSRSNNGKPFASICPNPSVPTGWTPTG